MPWKFFLNLFFKLRLFIKVLVNCNSGIFNNLDQNLWTIHISVGARIISLKFYQTICGRGIRPKILLPGILKEYRGHHLNQHLRLWE